MEHFMVKRAKLSNSPAPNEDGGCDTTYHLEEGGHPLEVKIKHEVSDSPLAVYSELLRSAGGGGAEGLPIPTELPDVPHQPEDVPPYRDRRRPHLFQKKWYKDYPWLHFDTATQAMYCYQCISAILKGVAECPGQNIFVRGGFKNWKKGLERFRVHENSSLHRDTSDFSVRRLFGLKDKCIGVEGILTSVNFLLGIGYDVKGQSLLKLLELRQNELPLLKEHLVKTGFSISDEKELLRIMTSSTMRQVSAKIKEAGPYGLVLEKVKVAGQSAFAVSARTCRAMKLEEFYLGLYTEQNILHELVNYLDADDLRLHSCDMVESKGIAEALEKIQPHVLHCPGPDLCGDLQEELKTTDLSLTMALLHQLNVFLRRNTNYIEDSDNQPLCSERTIGTFKTISTVLNRYEDVMGELAKAVVRDPGSCSARFLHSELAKRTTYFSLLMCKVLFYPVENLNSIVLKSETNQDNKDAAKSVLQILECSKTEGEFESFWHKFTRTCKALNAWSDQADIISETKSQLKKTYFDTVEHVLEFLKRKFHHPGYDNLLLLEKALQLDDDAALKRAETILKENDINPDSLGMEKRMLQKMIGDEGGSYTLPKIVDKLREMTGTQGLLPETIKLVDLLMLAQMNRMGVRALRLKKLSNFLKLNRGEDLVNELSILYVYRDENLMNFTEVAIEYIESDPQRAEALFKGPNDCCSSSTTYCVKNP